MSKVAINKIEINGVAYSVMPGGTKCSDCIIKDYCMNNGFTNGITIDCTSVHLIK